MPKKNVSNSQNKMSDDVQFKSKIGLIAATVGSAVGLGTIWRFPAETQANGGAAFLLVYVLCAFLLGVPVMISEFSIGRGGGSDSVGSFRRLAPGKPWWVIGAVAVVASYLIGVFYMVVGGWTLSYLWHSITGSLYDGGASTIAGMDSQFQGCMHQYVMTPVEPVISTIAIIVISGGILLGGVQKGIERMSSLMMPLLFVLMLAFCAVTLSLPKAKEGLEFFFSPDFSKITPTVVINALGQAMFSLSLGMGILITYASYFPADTKLTRTSVTVTSMTLVVAIMMGVIIFPAVESFGLTEHGLSGTTLVFVTLPEVFAQLPGTQLWSILFFVLLLVAAVTSIVSIVEVAARFVQNAMGWTRLRTLITILAPLFVLSSACALSFSTLADVKICGLNLFEALDTLTNNYMLPLVALGGCLFVGWGCPGLLRRELSNNGSLRTRMTGILMFIIRYIAPAAIVTILISNNL